ncbi:MAG: helix-hairpin-helix domain-containing protein [Spirochaetales bacterium]
MHEKTIAYELKRSPASVAGILSLLENGSTVPFIARYRKEQTGNADEEFIRAVRDRAVELTELDRRRTSMIESLRKRDLLGDELSARLEAANSKSELEDIYLPYRVKRRTRAQKAREAGFAPLADAIALVACGVRIADSAALDSADTTDADRADARAERLADSRPGDRAAEAMGILREQLSNADAVAGARDIIAEEAAMDSALRGELRTLFSRRSVFEAKRARGVAPESEKAAVYRDYFEHREPAARAPSHRVLAILRGEREGQLSVHLLPDEHEAMAIIRRHRPARNQTERDGRIGAIAERDQSLASACREQMETALYDSWKRLLAPSLENERKTALKEAAEREAAEVFAKNLRELLLAAPLGGKRVLAVDPGLRTGCKLVCLDEHGELLATETIYPLPPGNRTDEAARTVQRLCGEYRIEIIAVGNGTGGREAQRFLRDHVSGSATCGAMPVVSVNEAGASVYSASPVARREFPDQDVTVRGAVSIGRRLMDPLAELVKIEPKAIGVGQYQHDVDPALLDARLSDTVVSCVNAVGADLNTASAHLLRYVAGLDTKSADAVVEYRRRAGGFRTRKELLKVAGLGPRRFEQAAGFLRVHGDYPLDATAVHPERYALVERIAEDLGVSVVELVGNRRLRENIDLESYISDDAGRPTLEDIVAALEAPARDPRPEWDPVEFRDDVGRIDDLAEGMRLPGVVTNITDFGAFVDVGVHRDGLVHISKLADRFISDPHEVVAVGTSVEVTVVSVDLDRGRISLSMID